MPVAALIRHGVLQLVFMVLVYVTLYTTLPIYLSLGLSIKCENDKKDTFMLTSVGRHLDINTDNVEKGAKTSDESSSALTLHSASFALHTDCSINQSKFTQT